MKKALPWIVGIGAILGLAAIASSAQKKKSRFLQLLAILARDLSKVRNQCGSVGEVVANWVTMHGVEFRRLIALAYTATTQTEEAEEELKEADQMIASIAKTLVMCKDDPSANEAFQALLTVVPQSLMMKIIKDNPDLAQMILPF